MKYKAIIYDLDGTLLNTLDMNMYPLIQIIKEELNEDWTFEEVLKFNGYHGMKVMEELNIQDKEKTYARWVKYVNEYENGATLYEGIEQVLNTFDNKFIQAVCSSKMKEQYIIDVVNKGLDKYIKEAVLAEDVEKHKPHPDSLLLCLKRLGIQASEALYIGDAYTDYLAASAAKIDFGYAKWGSTSTGVDNPAYIFEKPLDILKILE